MATWAEIDRVVKAQQQAVAAQDAATLRRLQTAIEAAQRDVERSARLFEADVRAHFAAGETPDQVAWRMVRSRHYREMAAQLRAEADDLARILAADLSKSLPAAASVGAAHAAQLIVLATGTSFDVLNAEALRAIVAQIYGPGSPLSPILASLGPAAEKAAQEALVRGIAAGLNPNVVARQIVDQARGLSTYRARLISRTETLRAYRTAELESYKDTAGVVRGWAWHSALDRRTCPACWAMHGQVFDTEQPMGTHPNCRCSMVPVTRRLGPPISGSTQFRDLPEADQLAILGPAKHAAYKAGDLQLPDLVRSKTTPEWGVTRSTGSLVDAVGPAKAKTYYAAARA
jgi:SPP1 gp7 family putative phage head morphogenesis protein